jgi:nicotinic acid phosphoribosyltransferase
MPKPARWKRALLRDSRTRAARLKLSIHMASARPHNFSALTTDLYEVTMACGYWNAGVSDYEAAFHVTFRENPFGGEFTVACGSRRFPKCIPF